LYPATATPARPAQAVAEPIRVMLADDHAVTLWGLEQLVNSVQPRMTVVGKASTCADLLAHPALAETDVVLLDLGLSDRNAIECVQRLVANAGVKVVVLTGDLDPAHHREAVVRGARGVVVKSQPTEHILDAIESVHRGEAWLDGALMSSLLGGPLVKVVDAGRKPRHDSDEQGRIASLTPKEREVVRAVVAHRGAKSLVVADALGMSEHTLRNHFSVIYSKLHVKSRIDLYAFALEHGLASAPKTQRDAGAWDWPESHWVQVG
jgi:two-component system nitrate/nitrite response regulator NarL